MDKLGPSSSSSSSSDATERPSTESKENKKEECGVIMKCKYAHLCSIYNSEELQCKNEEVAQLYCKTYKIFQGFEIMSRMYDLTE